MSIQIDPEGNETDALLDLVNLDAREVLEIGCGDGRLTWRYADRAAHVTAIDTFDEAIGWANERLPDALKKRIEFHPQRSRSSPGPNIPPRSKSRSLPGRCAEWSGRAWFMPYGRSTDSFGATGA